MRGRCRVCKLRIEPMVKPAPMVKIEEDEFGLSSEFEEWPEQAVLIEDEIPDDFRLKQEAPKPVQAKPVPAEPPKIEIGSYTFASSELEEMAKAPPSSRADADWQAASQKEAKAFELKEKDVVSSTNKPMAAKAAPAKSAVAAPTAVAPSLSTESPSPAADVFDEHVDPLFGDVVKVKKEAPVEVAVAPLVVKPAVPVAMPAVVATPVVIKAPVAKPAPIDDVEEWEDEEEEPRPVKKKPKKKAPSNQTFEEKNAIRDSDDDDDDSDDDAKPAKPRKNEQPGGGMHTFKLSEAELNPERGDPPPKHLLFDRVFEYFLRPARHITCWLWIAFGTMVFLVQCWMIAALISMDSQLGYVGAGAVAIGSIWVLIWSYGYASTIFFEIITSTSSGNDTFQKPDTSWHENFLYFMRVAYYFGIASIPAYFLYKMGLDIFGYAAGVSLFLPLFVLSAMGSSNSFFVFEPGIFAALMKKIHWYLGVWGLGFLLWTVALGLDYLAVLYPFLIPVAALVQSAVWIIYARLIGRLGYLLMGPKKRKRKKKKRDGEETVNPIEPVSTGPIAAPTAESIAPIKAPVELLGDD